MLTPKEFLDKWDRNIFPLVEYDNNKVELLDLSYDDKEFLIKAGLPESAPPFINFESSAQGGMMKLIEKYNYNSDKEKYIYLGFTGSGDLICLIEGSGKIVSLDHEQEKKNVFINSSIIQLAECLAEYYRFVKEIKNTNGRRAFLERRATEGQLQEIINRIKIIDDAALKSESFWREELDKFNSV